MMSRVIRTVECVGGKGSKIEVISRWAELREYWLQLTFRKHPSSNSSDCRLGKGGLEGIFFRRKCVHFTTYSFFLKKNTYSWPLYHIFTYDPNKEESLKWLFASRSISFVPPCMLLDLFNVHSHPINSQY